MKYWLFAVFVITCFSDALLTEELLRFDSVMEANPLMIAAMHWTPNGMLLVKSFVCIALLLAWNLLTHSFLIGIAACMSAITCWNAGLLIWVTQND